MNTYHFSLKVGDQVAHFQDATLTISSPINRSIIESNLVKKLRSMNVRIDEKSFVYSIKDEQLYLEGWGYEDSPPPRTEMFFSV